MKMSNISFKSDLIQASNFSFMKKVLLGLLLIGLFSNSSVFAQKDLKNARALIKKMNKDHRGKWFDSFTFVQKTIRFQEDGSIRDSSIWYEAIEYPKNFRIDFGDLSEGNSNLMRNDSAYAFRGGELQRSGLNPQQFLLMKGGLYHYSIKETLQMLTDYGYDVQKFRTDVWNDRKVYVLGADKGDESSQQFWIDAEHFYLLRRISTNSNGTVLDVHYSDHVASGGGWVEQTVKFYANGRYIQLEYYQEIDTSPKIPSSFFDPKAYGKGHWYKD